MKRRSFCVVLGTVALPRVANAQSATRVYRVGVLRPSATIDWEYLEPALRELGYVTGRNLVIDHRFADGDLALLPSRALELMELQPDVIITVGSAATRAVRDATTAIPTVMFGNFDPVAAGYAASFARPGRNITGILISPEGTLAAKKMELLKEAVPGVLRIAMLVPDDANVQRQVQEVKDAAPALGLELVVVEGRSDQYEQAFATIAAAKAGALLVAAHTYFVRDRRAIIDLALRYRLPAIYEWPDQVKDGGLMAYGPSLQVLWQRIAVYVDRILKGAKAGDLPIELPTTLDLAINVRTARAIGISLPSALVARADEVIE